MRTSTVLAMSRSSDPGLEGLEELQHRESGRKFSIGILPPDLRRVYDRLEDMFDEEYALTVVFTIRTAVELHRAWHVSLLTAQILQQIKDKFKLRMTWNLGAIDLTFRIEDGLYELHRRVPYDYDSEFQNMYFKTAVALVEEQISVHDALIFQRELKEGKHTCPSGLFLRSNPGRLILYPFQAATCCVIFFSGDWYDAGVSAVCGLAAGLIEWALSSKNETKILIDCLVGLSTGVIGGLFYKYVSHDVDGDGLEDEFCLRAVFLGTLYWFFYGTAFVIGLLEIIASELQTGVTRFLAVAVKTFVLSIGSAVGLTLVLNGEVYDIWTNQLDPEGVACDRFGLSSSYPWDPWWRIPLYLLCSVSVLGQYRFIIMNYWAGLIVQLAAYVAQDYFKVSLKDNHTFDGMNTVFGDIIGAMASVAAASVIALLVDFVRAQSRIDTDETTMVGKFFQNLYRGLVGIGNCLGLGRGLISRSSAVRATLEEESKKQGIPKDEVVLSQEDEATLIEEAVEAQEYNLWSLLMPAIYQLVPGSKLAMYWYNVIFPPQPIQNAAVFYNETTDDFTEVLASAEKASDSAEYALWLTSVSLALGMILGLAAVRIIAWAIVTILAPLQWVSKSDDEIFQLKRLLSRQFRRQEMTCADGDDDPDDNVEELEIIPTKQEQRLRNRKKGTNGA